MNMKEIESTAEDLSGAINYFKKYLIELMANNQYDVLLILFLLF